VLFEHGTLCDVFTGIKIKIHVLFETKNKYLLGLNQCNLIIKSESNDFTEYN